MKKSKKPIIITKEDLTIIERLRGKPFTFTPNSFDNILFYFKKNYQIFSPQRLSCMDGDIIYQWWKNDELKYIEDLTKEEAIDALIFYEGRIRNLYKAIYSEISVILYKSNEKINKKFNTSETFKFRNTTIGEKFIQNVNTDKLSDEENWLLNIIKDLKLTNFIYNIQMLTYLKFAARGGIPFAAKYKPEKRKDFYSIYYIKKANKVFDILDKRIENDKK